MTPHQVPHAHVHACLASSLLGLEHRSAGTCVHSDEAFWNKCCRDGEAAALEGGCHLQWWLRRWGGTLGLPWDPAGG